MYMYIYDVQASSKLHSWKRILTDQMFSHHTFEKDLIPNSKFATGEHLNKGAAARIYTGEHLNKGVAGTTYMGEHLNKFFCSSLTSMNR